jgi:pimeloyl-ACP methyl ester carboxylesterase
MDDWFFIERDGVRLGCRDFGGEGPSVLLLHGLAGHSGEWAQTAGWLCRTHHVWALDQRGHGRSERFPLDISPAAYVADVVGLVERLDAGPVVLVGQSLGGQTAFLVAAERPDLVHALVVAEASPAGGGQPRAREVGERLASWPVPFKTREQAIDFFGGPSLGAQAWADGLERRDDGWWPAFDAQVLERTLREAEGEEYWDRWESIRCPTLVVRAERGIVAREEVHEMVRRLPQARSAELAAAEHDLHLDRPAEWGAAVLRFLGDLEGPATRRKPR